MMYQSVLNSKVFQKVNFCNHPFITLLTKAIYNWNNIQILSRGETKTIRQTSLRGNELPALEKGVMYTVRKNAV